MQPVSLVEKSLKQHLTQNAKESWNEAKNFVHKWWPIISAGDKWRESARK